jgi:hypothetical protein
MRSWRADLDNITQDGNHGNEGPAEGKARLSTPVEECTTEDRLSDGCDAGQDEVDAGQELLAVVVLAQLRRQSRDDRGQGTRRS